MDLTLAPTSTIHATCVAVGGWGILLTGPSGSGKSDLALRLIQAPDGKARLVGDDRIALRQVENQLVARPAPVLAGRMEVRGVGIIRFDYVPEVVVRLVVALTPREEVPRLPEEECHRIFFGMRVPLMKISPFESSALYKLHLALNEVCRKQEYHEHGMQESKRKTGR
ncbi:MAG: HPr kinase/phosphatase C-terminal domain-containing protein [Parvularculales bacterium]